MKTPFISFEQWQFLIILEMFPHNSQIESYKEILMPMDIHSFNK